MTVATVCIPWRPSPSRIPPYERVRAFWAEHFPDWPVIAADSDTEIFSLAQARNNAVRQAKTDVVVVCDADTIPIVENVRAAVADPVGVTWPHSVWRLIPADWVDRPYEDFVNAPTVIEYEYGLGSALVCTVKEWWRLGGQPEEFIGWGFEDCSFHLVVRTLSTLRRMPGVVYSIDHNDKDGNADSPGWSRYGAHVKRNELLARSYQCAAGRPWLMREVLKTRYDTAPENDPLAGRFRS